MQEGKTSSSCTPIYPDLVLELCPFECGEKKCEKEWINEQLGNKIICRCNICNHNRNNVSSNRGVLENQCLNKINRIQVGDT
jgi:hypothetical protein